VSSEKLWKPIRIFVAAPGDVAAEREKVASVVTELNQGLGEEKGWILKLREWPQVAPGLGRPQQVIFDQLPVEEWDLVIGILWNRFGSPSGGHDPETGRSFESGTEEEFVLAWQRWRDSGKPEVLFYRSVRPSRPDQIDPDQLRRVNQFFAGFRSDGEHPGLYKSYKSVSQFEKIVRADLEQVLRRRAERERPRQPAVQSPAPAAVPESPRISLVDGVEYVHVPAGPFRMGTTAERIAALDRDYGREEFGSEYPDHEIEAGAFYLSRYPVTCAQYRRFVEATGRPVPRREDGWSLPYNWNPETRSCPPGKEDHPVVLVSWHDARAYCEWAGGRLPTEAEWEKAARGTDGRDWPWGVVWQKERCNSEESGRRDTSAVGTYSPWGDSPYGAGDLAGNVWEWCSSRNLPYPWRGGDGREDPAAPGARVLRGGAFGVSRLKVRCAYRNASLPDDRGFTIGFRVVLDRLPGG
jgi:formylglycine-generating enzyme required for sulfatase activity